MFLRKTLFLCTKTMLEICALASGSNGNCYYIGNENEAVLIDAGIYYKHLVKRMNEAGLSLSKIKAIFISHEHSDHVQGARVCSNKLRVPVYFTKKTLDVLYKRHLPEVIRIFEPDIAVEMGNLKVFPFRKMHDAADPCSFRIEFNGFSTGVMTDIGETNEILQSEFSKCRVVFLETNYDKDMLWNGSYPLYLKQRVDSEIGHLSNIQALELITQHASTNLKYLFLSHISKENNSLEKILHTFSGLNGKYRIITTSREGISEVLRFEHV